MGKRIFELRKTLHLTQSRFAARLGVKDNSISRLESGINNVTEQMIIAICREFGVNEEWLRFGNGEMFVANDESIISALAAEYKLDEVEVLVLQEYVKLSEAQRGNVRDFIKNLAMTISASDAVPPVDMEASTPPARQVPLTEDEAAELARQRFRAAQKENVRYMISEREA